MNFPIEQNFPLIVLRQPTFNRNSASKELSKLLELACEHAKGVTMRVRVLEVLCSLHDYESGQDLNVCALRMLTAIATRCFP
jgi:hypothetical protein